MSSIHERLEAIGAGVVILLGIALLVFPELSTSVIGLLLILVGVGMWLSKWRKTGDQQPLLEEGEEEMPPPQA